MTEVTFSVLNDVWLDNGLETLGRILKDSDNGAFDLKIGTESMTVRGSNFDKLTEAVGIAIKNSRQNLIVIEKDKKLGTTKEVKKDYILIQEGKKIKGKVAFKEGIYNEKATIKFVKEVFDLVVETGDRKCVLCGERFFKPIKKLQQAAYPFVTKIRSLSGVRSYKDGESYSLNEYFEDFCPKCYLLGITEWLDDAIIYRTIPGEKSLLFLPHFNDLQQLSRFKRLYRKLLNKNSRWCNIRVGIDEEKTENTYGSFSTLLCFYEKFFLWADKKEVAGNAWVQIDIPFGAVKNIKCRTINLGESSLGIIKELSEKKISPYKGIINGLSFFYDNPKGSPVDWDLTHEIREDLSKAILEHDFHSFVNRLLPRKGGHMGCSKDTRDNLEDLIYVWRLKNMGIPKERLDAIKSVGNIVAKASRTNPSLLFKLDKARTTSDFWSVLREISRKLIGFGKKEMVKPTALDGLIQLVKENEADWKEIRDLLVIYSAMYYSIGGRKEDVAND